MTGLAVIQNKIKESLDSIFSTEISSGELEVTYGLTEMSAMNAVRLSNSSNLTSTNHALGHAEGLFQAEADLMIMVEVTSGFDMKQNIELCDSYADRIISNFITDHSSTHNLAHISGCTKVDLDFYTLESDQLNNQIVSVATISILWEGELYGESEI